jgi:hypothetical protein
VAVRDLVIQPREDDLLIATHGRGVWIVDDIRCLRGLTPAVLASDAAMLESRPAVMRIPTGEQRFDASEYVGRSLPEAAFITYYLKKRHMFGDLKLEVFDAKGQWLSSVPAGKRRGINRVAWPMRIKPPSVPPAANLVPNPYSFIGPRVPEGTYTVKLTRDKDTLSSNVTRVPDPREKHNAEDRALQQSTVRELYAMLETLTYVADAVVDARTQTDARLAKLGKDDPLAKKLGALSGKLDQLHKSLSRRARAGSPVRSSCESSACSTARSTATTPAERVAALGQAGARQAARPGARPFDALMSRTPRAWPTQEKSLEPIEGLTRAPGRRSGPAPEAADRARRRNTADARSRTRASRRAPRVRPLVGADLRGGPEDPTRPRRHLWADRRARGIPPRAAPGGLRALCLTRRHVAPVAPRGGCGRAAYARTPEPRRRAHAADAARARGRDVRRARSRAHGDARVEGNTNRSSARLTVTPQPPSPALPRRASAGSPRPAACLLPFDSCP